MSLITCSPNWVKFLPQWKRDYVKRQDNCDKYQFIKTYWNTLIIVLLWREQCYFQSFDIKIKKHLAIKKKSATMHPMCPRKPGIHNKILQLMVTMLSSFNSTTAFITFTTLILHSIKIFKICMTESIWYTLIYSVML